MDFIEKNILYKNEIYKYLKTLFNFSAKWYNINFVKVYNKMTNFTNTNKRKKCYFRHKISFKIFYQ